MLSQGGWKGAGIREFGEMLMVGVRAIVLRILGKLRR